MGKSNGRWQRGSASGVGYLEQHYSLRRLDLDPLNSDVICDIMRFAPREYQAVLMREEHRKVHGLSERQADLLVTFNQEDFVAAAKDFALKAVRPSEALWRLRAHTKG